MAANFQARMRMRGNQATRGMARIMGDVMRDVGREVVLATPVKTGVMRSNWQAGFTPISTVVGAYKDHGSYAGSGERAETRGPNYDGAVRQHQLVAAAHTNPSLPLFITNSVHYLSEVNFGTAAQTPIGFFERGIDRGVGLVRAKGHKIFRIRGPV